MGPALKKYADHFTSDLRNTPKFITFDSFVTYRSNPPMRLCFQMITGDDSFLICLLLEGVTSFLSGHIHLNLFNLFTPMRILIPLKPDLKLWDISLGPCWGSLNHKNRNLYQIFSVNAAQIKTTPHFFPFCDLLFAHATCSSTITFLADAFCANLCTCPSSGVAFVCPNI